MRTGGTGAFLGQQWDPSQWNTDLGLGYNGVSAGQQQGFAQGVMATNGAKGNAAWPAWSGSQPHPLAVLANHLANSYGVGSESDSGGGGYGDSGSMGGFGDTPGAGMSSAAMEGSMSGAAGSGGGGGLGGYGEGTFGEGGGGGLGGYGEGGDSGSSSGEGEGEE